MATTQCENPNERVDHPRHYNQHPTKIECIELIEHLPCNLANAVKYIWRCGLKQSESPKRDLQSALWYTEREVRRIDLFELSEDENHYLNSETKVVWRALARQIVDFENSDDSVEETILSEYLALLLDYQFDEMARVLNDEIEKY